MSQQPNNPQRLDLRTLAQNMMGALQRHFDMLAFNLAARESVTEEAYKKQVKAPAVMPAAPAHQNFEQMQAYARDLMVRQSLNDTLNLCVSCLNNCHLFLALIKAQHESGGQVLQGEQQQPSPEAQQQAQKAQQSFVQAPLHEKFNILETDYDIICEVEDTIVSLGFLLQALMQQNGKLTAAQCTESGELVLELKVLDPEQQAAPGEAAIGRLKDKRMVYRQGEVVYLESIDLQHILNTTAYFFDQMFKEVHNYGRKLMGEPPAQS